MVHAEEDRSQFRPGHDARIGAGIDAGGILNRNRLHDVDLPAEQRSNPGGIVSDGGIDHIGDITLDRAPIIGINFKGRLHARLTFAHHVGASPVALERSRIFDAFATIDGDRGAIGFAPLLVHDVELLNHVREDRKRGFGFDLDRVIAELANILDVVHVTLHVRAFARRPLEREQHVFRCKSIAVLEFDALTQFETPDVGRSLAPARGQRRGQAEVLVARHERFVDVAHHAQLEGFVQRMGIHRKRIALVADSHRLRLD